MKLDQFQKDQIDDALDKVLSAQRTATHADINAGLCGTNYDYKKAMDAEDKLYEAKEEFINSLKGI